MYIDETWYDPRQIKEFLEKNDLILTESANVKTRVKLARAARRTARRRAFIRRLRAKKRKQNPALRKRAYSEVRSALRKKLYKGKWKNLSYAARQRIDTMLQKRKPMINRMINRMMPSVVRGETKRLQKLNKK